MHRALFLIVVPLMVGVVGCASGGGAARDSRGADAPKVLIPTNEQVQGAAPVLAEELNKWRVAQRANERLLVRGPAFVGLSDVPAREASAMGTLLGEAINQHADPRLRFVAPGYNGDDLASADSVLDARATWEPAAKSGSDRSPRIGLEVIDPRNGQAVFSKDAAVPAALPARASAEGRGVPSGTSLDAALAAAAPAADKAVASGGTPVAGEAPTDKSSPPPGEASAGKQVESAAPAAPRERDARRVTRRTRPSATGRSGRSVVVPLSQGVVYFADAGLADRVIILQERTATADNGALSIRFVLTSRKGKRTLEIRCDFYDEQGAGVGGVKSVKLPIREGVPATVSLASLQPASGYVVFIKD